MPGDQIQTLSLGGHKVSRFYAPLGYSWRRLSRSLVFLLMLMPCTLVQAGAQQPAKALSENQKIEALIRSVEELKDAKFYRNGALHDAASAAKHLRMKWNKAGSRIKTATDFIEKVASSSSVSGEAYQIVYANGKRVLARQFFYEKLKGLNG